MSEVTTCTHPIEMGDMFDWIEIDKSTLIIIAKCGNCGSRCKITVKRHEVN